MTYRTCAGHYSYHNRQLGAVVVKPRTRGCRDLSGVLGLPYHGLRYAIDELRERGGYGFVAYRLWANNWIILYHQEGVQQWECGCGVVQSGYSNTLNQTPPSGESVSTAMRQGCLL